MMQRVLALAIVLAAAVVISPPAVAQQGPDDLWEMTVKMEMPGMPFAMPPQTQQVCVQKGKTEEAAVPQDKNCRITDQRRSGNRTTMKMVCEGKEKMTGTLDVTHSGDSYQGTMQMQMVTDGQQMNATQTFSGKRIGNCTWRDKGKEMVQQVEADRARGCQKAVDDLNLQAISYQSPVQGPVKMGCDDYRLKFCSRVSSMANEMREPSVFGKRVGERSDWPQLMQYCSVDANAVWTSACNKAAGTRNWDFLAKYCEAQAKQIALQNCTGRDYTAIMEGPYGKLCQHFPPQPAAGGRTPRAPQPAQAPAAPVPMPAGPAPQYPPQPAGGVGPYPASAPAPQYPAQTQPPAVPQQAPVAAPNAPAQQEPGVVDKGLNLFKGIFGR